MSRGTDSYTYNRKNFENSEFPILCETCLGSNPYIRMQKDTYGGECRICDRPFTTFRWMPGRGARYKKTEICQTCAKLKNVCQTCLLDLEYGLPVQVRDQALAIRDEIPKCGANRDYYLQNADRGFALTDGTTPGGKLAAITGGGSNTMLKKLARTQPYYDRNMPHICSFFVKGECNRGEECPYRHEKPTDPDNPLSQQNMRDRYYGTKDPVAEKLLNRAKALPKLSPPEDSTVTTLYLGNLGSAKDGSVLVTEKDLRDYFYQFGEIRQLHVVSAKYCAFIAFTTREAAESAADGTFEQLVLRGQKIRVRWGQPKANQSSDGGVQKPAGGGGEVAYPVPNLPNLPVFFPPVYDQPYNGPVGGGPSSSKRARMDLPMPPQPPLGVGPSSSQQPQQTRLIVPAGIGSYPGGGGSGTAGQSSSSGSSSSTAAAKIYYASQDPQRLGAKGDVVD